MSIAEVCIKRPVFATVLSLIVIVLGLMCQSRLPVRQKPKVDSSFITVETQFHGASPKVVESTITRILEGQFATIPGVELIKSTSENENSKITIEFTPDRTPDGAASDVRDRLSTSRSMLPLGIPESIIRKDDTSGVAGIYIGFTSTQHDINELRDYVDKYIKSKFEALPGVGRVNLDGGQVLSMRLFLDPQKLAAYGYTPADIVQAVDTQHTKPACGSFISKDKEYMLVYNGELGTPQDFDNMVLPILNDNHNEKYQHQMIKIKDVGKAKLVPGDIHSGAWFNGQECVTLSIVKQPTANPIELSRVIREKMPEILEGLPTGVKGVLALDEAEDIEASINNVYHAIFEATLLVVLVVFLFLWSFRATLIPIVTIPISLLGTFALLEVFDFSINVFTLLAMVLAVGLVVDDAIVVLENIHRYLEKGMNKVQAAIEGSKEITFSIIAMTLTLATAYIPIAMTPGRIGKCFREFALTLSGAVLISGFIALTLSPMMCSKLLSTERRQKAKGFWKKAGDYQQKVLKITEQKYQNLLATAIRKRVWMLLSGFFIAALGAFLIFQLPSESEPMEDMGQIDYLGHTPVSASYEFIENNAKQIDWILAQTPYLKNRWMSADRSKVSGWLRLVDWNERDKSAQEVAAQLQKKLRQIPAIPCRASAGSSSTEKLEVEFVLMTNQSYEYLMTQGHNFLQKLLQYCQSIDKSIRSTIIPAQEEYTIDIDREKAASLGVSARDVGDTISFFIQGKKAANVQRGSKRDELFVQVEKDLRRTPEDLNRMSVRSKFFSRNNNSENKMVPLSDLITVTPSHSPMNVNHYNQMLSVTAFADVAAGHSLGEVVEEIEALKNKYLPNTMQLAFTGATKSYLEESKQIAQVFWLALVFVLLILAAQFESFIDPFIIILSVPFSITGALITLWIVPEGTLNIYSKVGLVTLIGLITKHGILIVDFANALREKGKSVIDAVEQAAVMRLRPILMTTFAMVIGTVPLALATGAGAGARRQIGWAIVGGMSFGTCFTLFIVPIIYIYFAQLKKFFAKW